MVRRNDKGRVIHAREKDRWIIKWVNLDNPVFGGLRCSCNYNHTRSANGDTHTSFANRDTYTCSTNRNTHTCYPYRDTYADSAHTYLPPPLPDYRIPNREICIH